MKKNIKQVLRLIGSVFIGIIVGAAFAHFSKIKIFSNGEPFLFGILKIVVFIFIVFILNVIVHEAGHLIFGLISGYTFLSFRIFNIILVKINGKFKIKKYAIAGTGGQCIMIPPKDAKNFPYILYNLGGIISGLVFAIICFIISKYVQGNMSALLLITGFIAVIIAVMNGIPFKSIVQNDAKNILDLRESEDNRASFYTMLKVEEALTNGKRVKDLPSEYFSLDIPYENSVFGMANEMIKYAKIFADGDFEKAEKRNDELREISSLPLYKHLLLMDKIYMLLLRNESSEEVKKLLSDDLIKTMKMMQYESTVLRTQYIIEKYVNKDEKKSKKALERFRKFEKHCHKMGEYEQEKEFIELLDSRREE